MIFKNRSRDNIRKKFRYEYFSLRVTCIIYIELCSLLSETYKKLLQKKLFKNSEVVNKKKIIIQPIKILCKQFFLKDTYKNLPNFYLTKIYIDQNSFF